jgi:hypothetical protein
MLDQREPHSNRAQAPAVEQGQADRTEAAVATEARLVDPHQTADRPADP